SKNLNLRKSADDKLLCDLLAVVSAVPSGLGPCVAVLVSNTDTGVWHKRPTTSVTSVRAVVNSFQKQTHAIEIDDGMIDVERVHAENSGDFGVALLQREQRQRSDAKFFTWHLERANVEVVEFCRAHPFRCFAAELCRDPRRFRRESERFNETF